MKQVFRAVLMLTILALGTYLLGYWAPGDGTLSWQRTLAPVAGRPDATAVRSRLDRLDEQSGRVADRVGAFMSDAEVSGKIKSKMALDETVRARAIDVSTDGGVVTLAGMVRSIAERDQAVRLAQNTSGALRVMDRLVVVPPQAP